MKPSEEVHHISLVFERMRGDNDRLLKFVERIRKAAIAYLKEIIPTDTDLTNYDQGAYYCSEIQRNPEHASFQDAAIVLRQCNHALESGRVERGHIDRIIGSYAGLNKTEEVREIIEETKESIIEGSKINGAKGGDKSARVRRLKAEPIKEAWQAEADKIWQKTKNSKLSKSSVAKLIAKKIDGNPDTIRRSIKKPLP